MIIFNSLDITKEAREVAKHLVLTDKRKALAEALGTLAELAEEVGDSIEFGPFTNVGHGTVTITYVKESEACSTYIKTMTALLASGVWSKEDHDVLEKLWNEMTRAEHRATDHYFRRGL